MKTKKEDANSQIKYIKVKEIYIGCIFLIIGFSMLIYAYKSKIESGIVSNKFTFVFTAIMSILLGIYTILK